MLASRIAVAGQIAPPLPEGPAPDASAPARTPLVDGLAAAGVGTAALSLTRTTFAASGAATSPPATRKPRSSAGYAAAGTATASAAAAKGTGTKKTAASGGASSTKASSTSASGTKASSTSASGTKALAFLDDASLPVEEKLFRFMMYVADKYDKDLEKKMKEIAGGAGAAKSSSGGGASSSKSGGLLGKLGGALKTVFPAAGISLDLLQDKNVQALLKSVSGPVLAAGATALGFPELAPALLKLGPELANGVIAVAKQLDAAGGAKATGGSTGAASGSGSKTSGSSSSSATGEPELDRAKLMELEYAVQKQQQMFTLVSNLLKSMHDTRMAMISNTRG